MDTENQQEAFHQEMNELLAEVEESILEVENSSDLSEESDGVNRLFRAMHSIKGIAGMFGFDLITDFTHHVETTLDLVRTGTLPVSKELINLVLKSHDLIILLLDSQNEFEEIPEEGIFIISSLEKLTGEVGTESEDAGPNEVSAVVGDGGLDSNNLKGAISTYRIVFKPHDNFFDSGNSIKTIFEEIKLLGSYVVNPSLDSLPNLKEINPGISYLKWDILLTTKSERNNICDIFIFAEDHCELEIKLIDEIDDEVDDEALDRDYKKVGEILVDRGALTREGLEETLSETSRIGDILVEKNLVAENDLEMALTEQKQVRKIRNDKKKSIADATIRVQAQKLDSLVSLVGELVTAQARLSSIAVNRNDCDITSVSETLQSLVSGLRDETMSIRMVPIGTIFTTFKRLVRDLAGELGKEINLKMIGAETELDKTVIERLKDPLVHIVRNAVDHGVESVKERIAAGKEKVGNLTLKAEHSGAYVQITVEDDGKGLDLDRIRKKAIEKKLVSAEDKLTDHELSMMIFTPGFSTAENVTDISGRGVGMDVVKQNIDALRGSISVDTEMEKGTKMILRLPLTLAIIDGLMVDVAGEYYIIPLSMVEECMDLNMSEVDRIKGRNILNLRGKALPFIKLRDSLELNSEEPPLEQVVITNVNGVEVGFVVDMVVGSHQTVIKSLGPGLKNAKHISGATILGDGTVALILDIQKLL